VRLRELASERRRFGYRSLHVLLTREGLPRGGVEAVKKLIRRSLARAVAKLPTGVLTDKEHADIFQKAGIHITRDHFYEPIPNTDRIDRALWNRPSDLPGIKTNVQACLEFLRESSSAGYFDEFHRLPKQSTQDQYGREGSFGGLDGAFYYCALRKYRPSQIIEVGAGQSTLLARSVLKANMQPWHLTAIDPYPQPYLKNIRDLEFELIENRVERVPLSTFERLNPNDMLFIDSSHVVRIDGDVLYEVLEILPRLKVGVVIYIHDIYLPYQYPMDWILRERRFWTEQYIVQAFLAFNNSFEIVWSAGLMVAEHFEELMSCFPYWQWRESQPSSLVLRRIA
jgi:Methyltransferase domain